LACLPLTRAPLAGACLFAGWLAAAHAQEPCPADRVDQRVVVARVFDGDTLRLSDGRVLRLVGVNTPERARDDRPAEPGAAAATAALRRLAPPGSRLALRLDAERRDRHGRLLAHAFTPGGRNLTRVLLEEGHGFHLVIPPNVWAHACYRAAERRARAQRRGVWRLRAHAPLTAADLAPGREGFHRVRGRVQRVGRSRRSLWLNLEPPLAIRIPRADLRWFDGDPAALAGRRVEARGWLRRHRGRWWLTVRHPDMLEIDPPQETRQRP